VLVKKKSYRKKKKFYVTVIWTWWRPYFPRTEQTQSNHFIKTQRHLLATSDSTMNVGKA